MKSGQWVISHFLYPIEDGKKNVLGIQNRMIKQLLEIKQYLCGYLIKIFIQIWEKIHI
jgi:hypothetical protein